MSLDTAQVAAELWAAAAATTQFDIAAERVCAVWDPGFVLGVRVMELCEWLEEGRASAAPDDYLAGSPSGDEVRALAEYMLWWMYREYVRRLNPFLSHFARVLAIRARQTVARDGVADLVACIVVAGRGNVVGSLTYKELVARRDEMWDSVSVHPTLAQVEREVSEQQGIAVEETAPAEQQGWPAPRPPDILDLVQKYDREEAVRIVVSTLESPQRDAMIIALATLPLTTGLAGLDLLARLDAQVLETRTPDVPEGILHRFLHGAGRQLEQESHAQTRDRLAELLCRFAKRLMLDRASVDFAAYVYDLQSICVGLLHIEAARELFLLCQHVQPG